MRYFEKISFKQFKKDIKDDIIIVHYQKEPLKIVSVMISLLWMIL